jgi:hypothetical protein
MSHHFKNKMNPIQRGFLKIKSATTNSVACLNSFYLVISTQGQVDSTYVLILAVHLTLFHTLCYIIRMLRVGFVVT